MRYRPVRFLALVCLGVLGPAAAPSGSYAQEDLAPCADRQDALCGTLTVFEDRAARRGRTIDLEVVVLPSRSENPREPVFSFAGGPGGAATELIPLILGGAVDNLREERDVVLVDRRGTGGSHPLYCPPPAEPQDYFGHVFDPEWVTACRSELTTKADLALYTTSIAMDDVDEVRAWLGYEKIVILSVSYGTRAAMEYMRRHGEHVAAAILDGVAAFSTFDPLYYAHDAQQALERVFAGCTDDERCAKSYPRLRHSFRTVLDRFREGPRPVEIQPGDGAEPAKITYSFKDFAYTIRGMLYDEEQTLRLPRLVTEAAEQGELSPFAQAYYDRAAQASSSGGLALGLYLSVVCTEDVPFVDADAARRWSAGNFLGDYLVDDYKTACSSWPRGKLPKGYHDPLTSDIPTLVLSGGHDPVTPPHWGEEVARHLSRSLHVIFPQGGHVVSRTPCGTTIVGAFLKRYSVEALDTSCSLAPEASVPFEHPAEA